MSKDSPLSIDLVTIFKMIKEYLQFPTMQQFDVLNDRIDRLERIILSDKAAAEKDTTETPAEASVSEEEIQEEKPAVKKITFSDQVLETIAGYPKGVDLMKIQKVTGFDAVKIRNSVYRLTKIEKIKKVKRGVYKIA